MTKRFGYLILLFCTFLASSWAAELSLKQRLILPGPLTEAHAEFEPECENCHNAFDKKGLTDNCLACHEDIANDRKSKLGFHGIDPNASSAICNNCHIDHEGRDANILGFSIATFSHKLTNFPLDNAHLVASCVDCHETNQPYRDAPTTCFGCHESDDIHQTKLGETCNDCHQTTNWQDRKFFDHSKTDFLLHGKHDDVPCMACHVGQKFEFKDISCVGCHTTDDVHLGANGSECQQCHSEKSWATVLFDHDTETDFKLLGEHQSLPCRACHEPEQKDRTKTASTCIGCHKNDDVHFGRFGTDCKTCHNNSDWGRSLFDHTRDTDFALTGAHQKTTCTLCHEQNLSVALDTDCVACHKADDVHQTAAMQSCADCHSTDGWRQKTLFDHDFTAFPLVGMHSIVPCATCHGGHDYSTVDQQCTECHEKEDVHRGSLGNECAACHNPNGWGFWTFDHNLATDFKLEDAHKGLACNDCHNPGTNPKKLPDQCVSCHRADDVHKGGFGPECSQCHNTKDFSEFTFGGSRQ